MRTLIILVVLAGLTAVAASILVGRQYFDGVVVDRPYERGLDWDRVRHEREATGWQAEVENRSLKVGNNELILSVRDRKGNALAGAEVSITISRPSTKAFDREHKADMSADGLYRAAVFLPLYGYWDIKISILKGGEHADFESRIFAERGT